MTVATSVWALCIASAILTAIVLESNIPERLQAHAHERVDGLVDDVLDSSIIGKLYRLQQQLANSDLWNPARRMAKPEARPKPASATMAADDATLDIEESIEDTVAVTEPEDETGHVGRIVSHHGHFVHLFKELAFTVHARGHQWLEGKGERPVISCSHHHLVVGALFRPNVAACGLVPWQNSSGRGACSLLRRQDQPDALLLASNPRHRHLS